MKSRTKLASLTLAVTLTLVGSVAIPPQATRAAGEQNMCMELYKPVCAVKKVECFTTPCYPVYETYSNTCFMQNANATFIHDGECTATETGPFKGTITASTSVTVGTGQSTSSPILLPPPGHPYPAVTVHATTSATVAATATSTEHATTTASSSTSASVGHHTFFSVIASWWGSFLGLFS